MSYPKSMEPEALTFLNVRGEAHLEGPWHHLALIAREIAKSGFLGMHGDLVIGDEFVLRPVNGWARYMLIEERDGGKTLVCRRMACHFDGSEQEAV